MCSLQWQWHVSRHAGLSMHNALEEAEGHVQCTTMLAAVTLRAALGTLSKVSGHAACSAENLSYAHF